MIRKKLIKSEVCHLFNISKEFLRHYENNGLLNPEIDDKKYRYYDYEDIHNIREILLLRDLDLSIKDMKIIKTESFSKQDFKTLIKNQKLMLKDKIIRLENTLNDITQLSALLEENDTFSFLEKKYPPRYYILTSSSLASIKTYYDDYKSIIEEKSYSEKNFQMIYTYNQLVSEDAFDGDVAIESSVDEYNIFLEEGYYLSIFFPFEHGNFKNLNLLTKEIENYLESNNLTRVDDYVLEKEHPELSLFINENTTIFEIQLRVERKNNDIL